MYDPIGDFVRDEIAAENAAIEDTLAESIALADYDKIDRIQIWRYGTDLGTLTTLWGVVSVL